MNDTTMTATEAGAVVTASLLRSSKTQMARLMATKKAAPASMDWLIERGYVVIRVGNKAASQFTGGEFCAYLTPAGKEWQSRSGGLWYGLNRLRDAGQTYGGEVVA